LSPSRVLRILSHADNSAQQALHPTFFRALLDTKLLVREMRLQPLRGANARETHGMLGGPSALLAPRKTLRGFAPETPCDTTMNDQHQTKRAITVRLRPSDYATIAKKAASCGLPIAEFVRRCSLGRRTPSHSKLIAVDELRRLGELQQQLASVGDVRRQRYVTLLEEIRAAIGRLGQ